MQRRSFPSSPPLSADDELRRYHELQQTLLQRWQSIHRIDDEPKDIVIIPSLSLEGLPMADIPGVTHYEERMLFTLSLLRHPRAHLVYVTSQPLHPATVDYMLSLLQGIPMAHARQRLTLLATYDASPRTLTEKILERPRLVERIRRAIDPANAHMTCFTVSPLERTLAVRLGIPLYGPDPALLRLGTKTGSRQTFRRAGVSMPAGVEGVRDERDVARAVADLWEAEPGLQRVVVKHDQGFSGEGNAVLSLKPLADVAPGRADRAAREDAVRAHLEHMRFGASFPTWERFGAELERQGGIVEAFIEGASKRAPSGQLRIDPRGRLQSLSTHDQILGGPDNQSYEGCRFPADEAYRLEVQRDTLAVGEVLRREGVIGRAAVDFVTVERPDEPGTWDRYAIEINLRMSGTTHPLMILKMLNAGSYDETSGLYFTKRGEARFYVATDSLKAPSYRGLLVDDVLDIAAVHRLHYTPWTDTGVIFHLTGALSQFGKVGITAIGQTQREAQEFFDATRKVLDAETR